MSSRSRRFAVLFGGIGIGVAVLLLSHRPAYAQGMVRAPGAGEFHFNTHIGSFKLLGTDDQDVTGTLEMTAKGTILVSGVDTVPATTGTLKLEYSYKPLKKYAFHGQGTLTVKGTWRSVQWFGTDLTGNFKGRGKFRLVGEFDKDLSTGLYWMEDPKDKKYWPANSVVELLIPGYTSSGAHPNQAPTVVKTPPPAGSKPGGK